MKYNERLTARQPFRVYARDHSADDRKPLLVEKGEQLTYLGEVIGEPQSLMVELRRGGRGERVFAKVRRELVDDLHKPRSCLRHSGRRRVPGHMVGAGLAQRMLEKVSGMWYNGVARVKRSAGHQTADQQRGNRFG